MQLNIYISNFSQQANQTYIWRCLPTQLLSYHTHTHTFINKSLNATGVGFTVGYHDVEKFKKSVKKFCSRYIVPIACIVC